jgi:two-component system phosphate regulon response regulator PhoB
VPNRPVIVLVEDHTDTRELYADSLAFSGFRVHSASNADDGFRLAVEHRPKAVVTDYVLRGGPSGAELCNRLKHDHRTDGIPTLLITASSQRQDAEAALREGCAVVRLKPYLPDALEHDIRALIAQKPIPRWPTEYQPRSPA